MRLYPSSTLIPACARLAFAFLVLGAVHPAFLRPTPTVSVSPSVFRVRIPPPCSSATVSLIPLAPLHLLDLPLCLFCFLTFSSVRVPVYSCLLLRSTLTAPRHSWPVLVTRPGASVLAFMPAWQSGPVSSTAIVGL